MEGIMKNLNSDFFENRTKKWWISSFLFWVMFFVGADQEFLGMDPEKFKPTSELLARSEIMLLCIALLLIYIVPFVYFTRYTCKKMDVSMKQTLFAFFSGWFIPGWIAGDLNEIVEILMKHFTSKSFVNTWGDSIETPIVEETLKVLVVVWVLVLLKRTTREDFLITGMSVGMGFQISEDLGYIEEYVFGSHYDFMHAINSTLYERVSGGLVSHWCYTALMAVAIWMIFFAKGKKIKGIALLLIPILDHAAYDSPLVDTTSSFGSSIFTGIVCAPLALAFVYVWIKCLPKKHR